MLLRQLALRLGECLCSIPNSETSNFNHNHRLDMTGIPNSSLNARGARKPFRFLFCGSQILRYFC